LTKIQHVPFPDIINGVQRVIVEHGSIPNIIVVFNGFSYNFRYVVIISFLYLEWKPIGYAPERTQNRTEKLHKKE